MKCDVLRILQLLDNTFSNPHDVKFSRAIIMLTSIVLKNSIILDRALKTVRQIPAHSVCCVTRTWSTRFTILIE